jgi:hypothetical protein
VWKPGWHEGCEVWVDLPTMRSNYPLVLVEAYKTRQLPGRFLIVYVAFDSTQANYTSLILYP